MLAYCLKCKKDIESVDSKILKTKTDRTMLSKFTVCGSKISTFIKQQEEKGLLTKLWFYAKHH